MIYRFHGVWGSGHHYLVPFSNTKDEILQSIFYIMKANISQKQTRLQNESKHFTEANIDIKPIYLVLKWMIETNHAYYLISGQWAR